MDEREKWEKEFEEWIKQWEIMPLVQRIWTHTVWISACLLRQAEIDGLLSKVKELETQNENEHRLRLIREEQATAFYHRLEKLEQIMTSDPDHWDGVYVDWATKDQKKRIKTLEEGIENWLNENNGEDWRERCEANLASAQDQELYKLLEGK
jgi:hypothetical protein